MKPSTASSDRRGRPLIAFVAIVTAWIAVRVAVFEPPLARWEEDLALAARGAQAAQSVPATAASRRGLSPTVAAFDADQRGSAAVGAPGRILAVRASSDSGPYTARPAPADRVLPKTAALPGAGRPPVEAGVARGLVPADPAVERLRPGNGEWPAPAQRRWSGDAWLAWREGSGALQAGVAVPTYGGSQAGVVLRYALTESAHRPAAYLRAVHALASRRESDLAAGVMVRVLPKVPLAAHIEARLTRRDSGVELRPAAFVSGGGETGPLVAGVSARGYVQAGYVGGRDATAFADGSAIAEQPVWRRDAAVITAGAGLWGGAQRGAARLDVGPSAGVRFPLGIGTARLSADYRLRVAGDARPASGPALTLSAGF